MTSGSHGDGDIGLFRRDHSQGEISPPNSTEAALPPLSPDGDGGDVKLEDIAGLSLARHKSQESKPLNKGVYFMYFLIIFHV